MQVRKDRVDGLELRCGRLELEPPVRVVECVRVGLVRVLLLLLLLLLLPLPLLLLELLLQPHVLQVFGCRDPWLLSCWLVGCSRCHQLPVLVITAAIARLNSTVRIRT